MTTLRLGSGLLVLLALFGVFMGHIAVGAKVIPLSTVVDALIGFDETLFDHTIIRELRLPRAVMAIAVGASLAIAGALMQAVTRNPLADPGLLGLLAGASFAVVLGTFSGFADPALTPTLAAIGAFIAVGLAWTLAAAVPGGATPMTLILSGAVITALLSALTAIMLLLDQSSFSTLRVWLTGTLSSQSGTVAYWASGWLIVGLLLSLTASRQVTALALGDETAIGLGVDLKKLRLVILISVVTLTAAAVTLAGPVGFVGLVVPHVVRLIIGYDYRFIVPGAALVGAIFMLLADIAARLLLAPIEISTGLITALLGAPVFIWLVRTRL